METFKNIVEEMRYVALRYLEDGNDSASVFEILSSYADRLDAAYKRDMQSMVEAGERDMEKLRDDNALLHGSKDLLSNENARLKKENTRLKAAMKPVIDLMMDRAASDMSMELAIMESQRIYCGGETK